MLSDRTLAEFTRQSPLQQHLVELAWPSLTTESKLQIIDAIQAIETFWDTPTWLLDLAMRDGHAIVRLWAARYGYFQTEREYAFEVPASLKPTAEDVARYNRARQDDCGLVRHCAERAESLHIDALEKAPQKARLLYIRSIQMPEIDDMVKFLIRGIEAGVPDEELSDCFMEFVRSPGFERKMADAENDHTLGAYGKVGSMEALWAVVHKAGRWLTNSIAFYAPVAYGRHTLKADFLAKMPEDVLANLPYRSEEPVVAELLQTIRDNPDAFPQKAVEALAKYDEHSWEFRRPSKKDMQESRLRTMADRQAALFELVSQVTKQLEVMQNQVAAVQEAAARKRGIFG